MKNRAGMVLIVTVLLAGFFFVMSGGEEKTPEAATRISKVAVPLKGPLYKEGELLVQMRPGLPAGASARAHSMVGASLKTHLGKGIELVKLPPRISVLKAMALYKGNPEVLRVSPNFSCTVNKTFPNDGEFDTQWGFDNTGQTLGTPDADIDAPEAWDIATGDRDLIIAVVDTGVDYTHPDLAPNMWTNTDELAADLLYVVTNIYDDDKDGDFDDFDGVTAAVPGDVPIMDFNGVDDDGDGVVDDLDGTTWYSPGLLDRVTNGVDDDSDGVIDDFDGVTAGVPGDVPIIAFNGIDDDGDGVVDDFDGAKGRTLIDLLTNGVDDDLDTVIDDFDGAILADGKGPRTKNNPLDPSERLPILDFNKTDDDGDGVVDDFDGTPLNGIDDDDNGYIDDIFGINAAIEDLSDPAAGDPIDALGHGTHVAGTIAAKGNNLIGVTGVNWNFQIMALRFADEFGLGYFSDEKKALDYLAAMSDRGEMIVAANASYGYFFPQFFEASSIKDLMSRGIIFVASAGNEAIDNDEMFGTPSSFDLPNIIAVAATDHNDRFAYFSNFGRRTVHVGAPGVNISSTLMGGGYGDFLIPYSGTSNAAPHVTGLVGLIYAAYPLLDPVADWPFVRNRILAGGDLNEFLLGRTSTGRRVNAFGALTCSLSEIFARVTPLTSETKAWFGYDQGLLVIFYTIIPQRSEVTAIFGEDAFGNQFSKPLQLSALNIKCGEPNTSVPAEVTIGGQKRTLLDDGLGFDDQVGDGVFSGSWKPPFEERNVIASFPNIGTSIETFNDTFTIRVRKTDHPFGLLVADAGTSQRVEEAQEVNLDGSRSAGDFVELFWPLFYKWEQIEGTNAPLEDDKSPFPSFDAPAFVAEPPEFEPDPNILRFRLTVTDFMDEQGEILGDFATDTVTIIVVGPPGTLSAGGGGSSCFIATAAYGSEDAHDVALLRRFRDQRLMTNALGRVFVQLYYKCSPPVASFITAHPALKKVVRIGLLPAVAFARFALESTTSEKVLTGVAFSLVLVGLLIPMMRRSRTRTPQENRVG